MEARWYIIRYAEMVKWRLRHFFVCNIVAMRGCEKETAPSIYVNIRPPDDEKTKKEDIL